MYLKSRFSFQCNILLKNPEGTLTAVMASPWTHQSRSEQKYAI